MKKLILLAALTFATSAFARGDKTIFKVSVSGPTAQAAYDNASALASAIEAAGPSYADFRSLNLPGIYAGGCTLSSNAIQDRDYLDRNANIVGQISYGVSTKTGLGSWTATVLVSCDK